MPVRSLRIIFSATSGRSPIVAASKPARTSCPAFIFSLWQLAQFCATSLFCASTAIDAAVAGLVEGCEAASFGVVEGVCALRDPGAG